MDAVYLQSQIQWGSGIAAAVDVELDCSVMAQRRKVVSVAAADPVAYPLAVANPMAVADLVAVADPVADPAAASVPV